MNTSKKQMYKREGNTFVRYDGRLLSSSQETKYKFKDLDGNSYNIYITPKGRAYYKKMSKNNVENKIYLPDDLANTILEELKSNKDKVLEKKGGIR